jgi:hypothetical protein
MDPSSKCIDPSSTCMDPSSTCNPQCRPPQSTSPANKTPPPPPPMQAVFREVVPIRDPAVHAKIHQAYRIAYLKDVILPRVLDDGTFATLSSLILFNNVEVRWSAVCVGGGLQVQMHGALSVEP